MAGVAGMTGLSARSDQFGCLFHQDIKKPGEPDLLS